MMGLLNFDNLGENALLQAGLGILANNQGHGGQFAPAFGQGTMQGLWQANEYKRRQQEALLRKQQMDMQQKQFEWKQQELADKKLQKEAQQASFSRIASDYNIDPGMLSTFPQIGESLLKDKLIPKSRKIGFTPSGIAYDENNPELQLGTSYAKAEDSGLNPNKPFMMVNGNIVPNKAYQDYEIRKAGAGASNISYGSPVAGVDANGNPVFFQSSKTGGAPSIVQGIRPEPKPEKSPTEGQAKAATFYSQMSSASNELNKLANEGGYDPASFGGQLGTTIATGITNPLAGEVSQRARQAQNQWAESFLRVKTGAAATKDEVKMNVETFFPKVGDTPAVIEQKARMRTQAENDVAQMTQNPNNILPKDASIKKPRNRADILKQYGVR